MDKFVLGSVVLIMFINSVHNSLPPANKNQLDEQSSEKKNVDAVTSRNINVDENTTNASSIEKNNTYWSSNVTLPEGSLNVTSLQNGSYFVTWEVADTNQTHKYELDVNVVVPIGAKGEKKPPITTYVDLPPVILDQSHFNEVLTAGKRFNITLTSRTAEGLKTESIIIRIFQDEHKLSNARIAFIILAIFPAICVPIILLTERFYKLKRLAEDKEAERLENTFRENDCEEVPTDDEIAVEIEHNEDDLGKPTEQEDASNVRDSENLLKAQ